VNLPSKEPMFKFIAKFGSQDSGNGQFKNPEFVATDEQGNIYVSDYNSHRIQTFDSNRQWLKSTGSKGSGNGQFNCTTGITFNHILATVWSYSSLCCSIAKTTALCYLLCSP
jgi:hypothetical protein